MASGMQPNTETEEWLLRYETVTTSFSIGNIILWSRRGKNVGFLQLHKDGNSAVSSKASGTAPYNPHLDTHMVPQMLWPASDVVSRYLISNSSLLQGKRVLELGSGVGLCGIVAAHYASLCLLTDCDGASLALLNANINRNSHMFMPNSVVASRHLWWGKAEDEDAISAEYGRFDVVIGSDIAYTYTIVETIIKTAEKFLAPHSDSVFILGYWLRSDRTEEKLRTLPSQYGLRMIEEDTTPFISKPDLIRLVTLRRF